MPIDLNNPAAIIVAIFGAGGIGAALNKWFDHKATAASNKRIDFETLDKRLEERGQKIESLLREQIQQLSAQLGALTAQNALQEKTLAEQSQHIATQSARIAAQEVEIEHLRLRLRAVEKGPHPEGAATSIRNRTPHTFPEDTEMM